MAEDLVLNATTLKGTDYDTPLTGVNTEIIGRTISDLFSPPSPNLPQLEKDLNRDGIVVNYNGTITLCKSVAEFQALKSVPDHIKNYILRVGHQGLFGGQASSTGPSNIARDSSNKSLIQEPLKSDAPLVLSIKQGKTTLVQTTNYAYTEFMDTEKLGNIQLSLMADLTHLPQYLDQESDVTLKMPIYLIASGDSVIMQAIRGNNKNPAIVLGEKKDDIQEAVRHARNDKLSLLTPEQLLSSIQKHKTNPSNSKDILENSRLLEEYYATDLNVANKLLDITHSVGAQLAPDQISRILMSSQGVIEDKTKPIQAKKEFFTKILGYVSKLEPDAKQESLSALNIALANIQKDEAYKAEYHMLSAVISKAKIQGIVIENTKKPSMLRRFSDSILRHTPSPTSSPSTVDTDSIESTSPPPSPPRWTDRFKALRPKTPETGRG